MKKVTVRNDAGKVLHQFHVENVEVEDLDDNCYVQVLFTNNPNYRNGPTYTYIDTYDELSEGDVVLVPTHHGNRIAVVVSLDKGSYSGTISRVLGRYELDEYTGS